MTTTNRRQPWLTAIICLSLGLVTACLYWPVHQHGFILLDDEDYLTGNPLVKMGITSESVHWAFTHCYAGNWHPLTWISHMLDCQWFGLDAGKHHLVNAAFHGLNALLLFLLLQRLTRTRWPSAFVAALFALHPLHVESVAWAAERKDVLSLFFFLLTLLAYTRFGEAAKRKPPVARGRWLWYGLALAGLALGLMSKSMLVTTPFVLLLLDFWPLERISPAPLKSQTPAVRAVLLEKIPFLLLSALSCAMTVWAQSAGRAVGSFDNFPVGARIANSLTAYLTYLEKLFWPVNLSIFYPFPAELPVGRAVIAFVLLALITALAVRHVRRYPYLLVGWLWYLGTLVPVIGLVQVGSQALADRYTYLPLIGLFIMLAWGFNDLTARWKHQKIAAPLLAGLVLIACAALTARQISFWPSTKTLFAHAAAVDDQNYLAWTVLGDQLRLEGKLGLAVDDLNRAIRLRRNSEIPWHGLALALTAMNKLPEAEDAYQNALKLSPENTHLLSDYAQCLITLGRLDDATEQLKRAQEVNPILIEPRLLHIVILKKQGRLNDALNECRAILQLEPANANALIHLASICSVLGRPDQASIAYRQAVKADPANRQARIGLGLALIETHNLAAAQTEFTAVLQTDPQNAAALDGLGFALAMGGQSEAAKARFAQALEYDAHNAITHLHYAMALAAQSEMKEAIGEYRKALEIDDSLVIALNNLAWILAAHPDSAIRNGTAAVTLAERSCRLTNHEQPLYLGTLAAAYAEAGRFDAAVKTAEAAMELAKNQGNQALAERNLQLLELYRTGKAFHESAK